MIKKTLTIDSFDKIKDLSIYKRNPVILWHYDYGSLPIGRVREFAFDKVDCDFIDPLTIFSEDKDRHKKFKKLIENVKRLYPGYTSDGKLLELSIIDETHT